ncbi:MAG: S1C family serine protease [Thiobacillaceae bacterium]
MPNQRHPLFRSAPALVLSLALAAPVFAGTGSGFIHPIYGYMGHPHGIQGMTCPYMQQQGMALAPGKTLGVMISRLPNTALDERGLGYGVLVAKVQIDGPAASAGIRPGDVILEFNGKPVFSGDRLRWLVHKAEAGKPAEVKLLRDKETLTVQVSPAELAAPVRHETPKPQGMGWRRA